MKCTVVYPGQFIVWVTCMLADYEDRIIAGMVKKGYHVSAASGNEVSVKYDNGASVLIALSIETSKEEKQAVDINKDIMDVLKENNFLFYSVIVSARAGSCWNGSNIRLPQKTQAVPPPIPEPEPDRNLN